MLKFMNPSHELKAQLTKGAHMRKLFKLRRIFQGFLLVVIFFSSGIAFAKVGGDFPHSGAMDKGMTLWQLITAGGVCMIFLGFLSVMATTIIIYHLKHITADKLVPVEFIENLLMLLEKKEYQKAITVCKQQENLIAVIAIAGLSKLSKGRAVFEESIVYEGKARIEKLWQNLTYLGDIAIVAPMLGLLGTVLGMIQAFNYFRLGVINPVVLAQGLAKAMINTAFGLIITVPALMFYSYFRGKLTHITATAERVSAEIIQAATSKEGKAGSLYSDKGDLL